MSGDGSDTAPLDPTGDDARIVHISLDERTVVRRSAEVEQERAIAVYDLLEDNRFRPHEAGAGPYHLRLSVEENRLIFDIRDTGDTPMTRVQLHLAPFRRVVKDYFQICESYYEAIKRLSPSQIEAIDMGRRGLHNEGSQMLRDRLEGRIALDHPTARRLFTLLCVLHIRG
ncbi:MULTISPECIES: UPF0262 family protein [Thalassobaculum]|uniref:UPF0262 protein SAMN05660686_04852 n=1 Tax=Thalassobaculum litoreum DSM 18839 TaxID=1123362 RepID=A0A8G2BMK7_9PROT|nr:MULTISPECIES: UPF0262 family protein [Thalassobaculum]SDG55984.1 Uncharacterized protein, UPF0262 family [Thalassobaculum litoreum DSM 18839]